MEVPRPSSRVEIVAAMRTVRVSYFQTNLIATIILHADAGYVGLCHFKVFNALLHFAVSEACKRLLVS